MKNCVEKAKRLVEEINSISGGEYEAFIDSVREGMVVITVMEAGCADCSLEPIQFLIPRLARKIGVKVRFIAASGAAHHSYTIEVLCLS